jgi:thiol peroxidase
MANITLGGNPTKTSGILPKKNTKAKDFKLTANDLSVKTLKDYEGQGVILNVFPSVDTGVCATSARTFNREASELKHTKVICVSRDLPFAQARFCGAEGLENVEMLSDFNTGDFGKDYGLTISDGAFAGLHSRCIIVLDKNSTVVYTEQVQEIGEEPDYKAALEAAARL